MIGWIVGGVGLAALVVGGVVLLSSRSSSSEASTPDPAANVPGQPRDDGARVASEALSLANSIVNTVRDAVQRDADGGARDKTRAAADETPTTREG
jgi:hypothetical protein